MTISPSIVDAFAQHCRRLLDAGCHGLGIFGTTGEANSLSVDERVDAIEALVADGIPADVLLPGTGACALPDAVRLSQAALALGAPGVLALPPFYYKGVSDDGLFRFFAELIERVGDDRLRAVPLPHPPADGARLLARADRPAAGRLPGHDRRDQGLRGRRGAHRAHLHGLPPADRVRRAPRSSCSTRCAGAATAASRPRSTSRRARPARSTTASPPARTPSAPRRALTATREFLDALPGHPGDEGGAARADRRRGLAQPAPAARRARRRPRARAACRRCSRTDVRTVSRVTYANRCSPSWVPHRHEPRPRRSFSTSTRPTPPRSRSRACSSRRSR